MTCGIRSCVVAMTLALAALGVVWVSVPAAGQPRPTQTVRPSIDKRAAETPGAATAGAKGATTKPDKTFSAKGGVKGAPKLVTWAYYRGHDPMFIAAMLTQVQAGKQPRSALVGLDTPAHVDAMLKRDWSKESASMHAENAKLHAASPTASGGAAGGGATGASANHTIMSHDVAHATANDHVNAAPEGVGQGAGYQRISAIGDEARLPIKLDLEQKSIELGDLYIGQSRRSILHFVAPADGKVTLDQPAKAKVTITHLALGTGEIKFTQTAMAIAGAAKAGGGAGGASGAPAAAGHKSTSAVIAKRELQNEATAAPWEINVKAGDEVYFSVTFAPKRADNIPDGKFEETITVHCRNYSAEVPVHAFSLGIKDGIDIDFDADEVLGVPGVTGFMPIELTNRGIAGECSITQVELPTGVTMDDFPTVKLAKGESRKATLNFHLSPDAPADDTTHWIKLKMVNGDRKLTISIPITIYQAWYRFGASFFDADNDFGMFSFIDVRNDGWVHWSGTIDVTKGPDRALATIRWNASVWLAGTDMTDLRASGTADFGGGDHMDVTATDPNLKKHFYEIADHGQDLVRYSMQITVSVF